MKPPFSEEILTVLYVLFRAEAALRAEDIIDTLEDTSIDYFTAHQILEHLLENKTVFSVKQNGYDAVREYTLKFDRRCRHTQLRLLLL